MNIPKKIGIGIASLALVGGLGFASSASAAGASAPARPPAEKVCARIDDINAHFAKVAERTAKMTEKLTAMRARAEEAGKTEAVARIDAKLAKVAERAAHAAQRLEKINTWAAEHCTDATT